MDPWDGWETGRVILALTAVFYLGIWVQLTLMHWGGAFKRKPMWVPVFATPLFAASAVLGLLTRDAPWGWIALGLLGAGIVEGLAGLFFHLQGIGYQIGGLASLRNLISGPPPVLPVAFSLIGVMGVLGLVWGA